ncbi:MAG: zinc ribbon domain-containing protein [Lachnospiraceae bacterium]|jgi:predicted nucleic acid-binding Zn ribbon protein|nr:zinc ribbon domain-containing protein [Lachnospiraceae bacterium]
MSFLDNLSNGVKEAGKAISSTTSSLSGQAKLTMEQSKLNGEIEEHYKNIGSKVYEAHAAGSGEPDIAGELSAVDAAKERIRAIGEEIIALKGCRVCPSCGASVPQDSQFCPSCGAKMPAKPVEQTAPAGTVPQFCTECGAPIEPGTKFCTKCGARIVTLQAQAAPAEPAPAEEAPAAPAEAAPAEAVQETAQAGGNTAEDWDK